MAENNSSIPITAMIQSLLRRSAIPTVKGLIIEYTGFETTMSGVGVWTPRILVIYIADPDKIL